MNGTNIWKSSNPTRSFAGLRPMSKEDEIFWEQRRERIRQKANKTASEQ
jgi:hypothetical protein